MPLASTLEMSKGAVGQGKRAVLNFGVRFRARFGIGEGISDNIDKKQEGAGRNDCK